MDNDANPHTNRPNGSPANSLQSSTRATPQEIMIEIARLEIHCPVFSPMTPESRREWIVTLCQDLAYKSLAELQYGARRYRTTAGNKWFPTPGAWLEACKNPFDMPAGKTYAKLEELPPPMDVDRAEQVIRSTYRKHQYFPHGEGVSLSLKEEILARPLPAVVPMTPERKRELLENLDRRLETIGHNG